jgi:hypothetical protein
MSLTDQAELKESYTTPKKKPHIVKFDGSMSSLSSCNYKTGHCTNTDACQSCNVYISIHEVRENLNYLKGND